MGKPVRVLIVDDSALVRKLLDDVLSSDPEIEVIARVPDPFAARDVMVRDRPDVVTLDVEMPRMDGVTFLRKMMAQMPTPTVMVSSLTERGARITIEALEAGAVEVLTKPKNLVDGVPEMAAEIREVVKRAARTAPRAREPRRDAIAPVTALVDNSTDKVIAIGASTGGVEAIARILPAFPRTTPGIVIVIHMPTGYTKSFAERLDKCSQMTVREAQDRERIRAGVVLVAPGGGQHTLVTRFGGQYRVRFKAPGPDDPYVPGVDPLFLSTASAAGKNAVGVVLTGMGNDGARGLKAMRDAGAKCLVQDEKSCVVFGMPKAALASGGAEATVPLDQIPRRVLGCFEAD